jgi:phospholipase/carboxylesterase
MIDGPRLAPLSGGAAKQLVVFLHGYGADGNDLIDLGHRFAPLLPDAAFVSPHAPEPNEMSAFGRQWFSLQARNDEMFARDAHRVSIELSAFLDAELSALQLDDSRLALVGFSQGTMIALHTAPLRKKPIAGIVGFSGRIMGPQGFADRVVSRPPVLLVHGSLDEILPVSSLADASEALSKAGFSVETIERPRLGHSIDEAGLDAGAAFLKRIFATASV